MSFALPYLLWLLAVPAGWFIWELARQHRTAGAARPKILRGEAGAHTVELAGQKWQTPEAAGHRPARWRLALGLALAVVALARPQWGRIEEPVFEQAREILIAVDLSRSMLAPDVKPSRLERARLLITSPLEKLKGERVGLIVFSGTAFLQSPLSADYEILREFLPALGPDYLPEGGTNFSALAETTLSAFGSSSAADRFLIVLSDGEANDDSWRERLDELKAKGVRVIGLGIGTSEGAMIPDNAGGFVKDERGAVVLSKLDGSTLRALADATGGAYADASAWVDLAQLLQTTVERGQRGAFREAGRVRLAERFQWALAPALLLLAWSFWREFPVRPKPRALTLADGRRPAINAAVAPVMLFLLASGLWSPAPARAVERTDLTPAAQLAQTIGKLATADTPAARDWADLANQTLTWGGEIAATQKPVPAGPVHDALTAVAAGAKLDPKAANWPALRDELEKLLQKSDEPPPKPEDKKDPSKQPDQPQDQQDQKDQKDPSKDQQSGGQGQSKDPSQSPSSSQNQPGDPSSPPQNQAQSGKPDQPSPSDSKPPSDQTSPTPRPGEQTFGDMKSPDTTPPTPAAPPPGEMQQVGGTPTQPVAATPADPALAVPLQKLDQLRETDSPVRLYQLIQQSENPTAPVPVVKKHNW